MNLAMKKGLKLDPIKDLIKRCRGLVSHFHHSENHTKALTNKQTLLNLPESKLKVDVETRWNSTYDMIDSVLKNEEAVFSVLRSERKYRHLILSADELSTLEEIRGILKPWKDLTVTLSSEKEVSISQLVPSMHKLSIVCLQDKELDSEMGRQMKHAMKKDLDTRYKEDSVKLFLNVTWGPQGLYIVSF